MRTYQVTNYALYESDRIIHQFANYTAIDCSQSNLSVDELEQLIPSIPVTITSLNLSKILKNCSVISLFTLFKKIPTHVTCLAISDNDLGLFSIESLNLLLSSLPGSITALNLAGNFTDVQQRWQFSPSLSTVKLDFNPAAVNLVDEANKLANHIPNTICNLELVLDDKNIALEYKGFSEIFVKIFALHPHLTITVNGQEYKQANITENKNQPIFKFISSALASLSPWNNYRNNLTNKLMAINQYLHSLLDYNLQFKIAEAIYNLAQDLRVNALSKTYSTSINDFVSVCNSQEPSCQLINEFVDAVRQAFLAKQHLVRTITSIPADVESITLNLKVFEQADNKSFLRYLPASVCTIKLTSIDSINGNLELLINLIDNLYKYNRNNISTLDLTAIDLTQLPHDGFVKLLSNIFRVCRTIAFDESVIVFFQEINNLPTLPNSFFYFKINIKNPQAINIWQNIAIFIKNLPKVQLFIDINYDADYQKITTTFFTDVFANQPRLDLKINNYLYINDNQNYFIFNSLCRVYQTIKSWQEPGVETGKLAENFLQLNQFLNSLTDNQLQLQTAQAIASLFDQLSQFTLNQNHFAHIDVFIKKCNQIDYSSVDEQTKNELKNYFQNFAETVKKTLPLEQQLTKAIENIPSNSVALTIDFAIIKQVKNYYIMARLPSRIKDITLTNFTLSLPHDSTYLENFINRLNHAKSIKFENANFSAIQLHTLFNSFSRHCLITKLDLSGCITNYTVGTPDLWKNSFSQLSSTIKILDLSNNGFFNRFAANQQRFAEPAQFLQTIISPLADQVQIILDGNTVFSKKELMIYLTGELPAINQAIQLKPAFQSILRNLNQALAAFSYQDSETLSYLILQLLNQNEITQQQDIDSFLLSSKVIIRAHNAQSAASRSIIINNVLSMLLFSSIALLIAAGTTLAILGLVTCAFGCLVAGVACLLLFGLALLINKLVNREDIKDKCADYPFLYNLIASDAEMAIDQLVEKINEFSETQPGLSTISSF